MEVSRPALTPVITEVAGGSSAPVSPAAGAARRRVLLNSACVVCGAENPTGLHLTFDSSEVGVTADWTPTEAWESFQAIVHGGIVTTVLDEAMSKAIIARHWEALTAEIRVRFRGQVSPGDALQVRGWVVEKRKRRILAEAALLTAAGEECAHAWATFLIPPGIRSSS
jgi:acyl-coenzyme A thioesterase PaaI-like protein